MSITATRAARPGFFGVLAAACRKLWVQVLLGAALGVVLALFDPALGASLKPLADAMIKAIRLVVTPIIFLTVVLGIATMGHMKQVGRVGVRALVYFEIVSTIALFLGLIAGNLWPVGAGLHIDPRTLDASAVAGYVKQAHDVTIVGFLLDVIPDSFAGPFVRGDILPVLFVAVLFGSALCGIGASARPLVLVLEQAAAALFGMVHIIMRAAPFAAFGALAFTVGKYGAATLSSLACLWPRSHW